MSKVKLEMDGVFPSTSRKMGDIPTGTYFQSDNHIALFFKVKSSLAVRLDDEKSSLGGLWTDPQYVFKNYREVDVTLKVHPRSVS